MRVFHEPHTAGEFAARFAVALVSAALFVGAYVALRYGGLARVVFGPRFDGLSTVDKICCTEKLLSIIHAVIATQGAVRSLLRTFAEVPLYTQAFHEEIVGRGVVPHRDFYVQLSIGYFLSDLFIYCLPPRHHTIPEFLHHGTALMSYGVGVYYEWASFVQLSFLKNEISTPFFQLTWFLKVYDMRLGVLDCLSRALFALLFFLSRLLWNWYVCYLMILALQHVAIPVPLWAYPFQLTTLALHVGLQVFWFVAIVRISFETVREVISGKPKHASAKRD